MATFLQICQEVAADSRSVPGSGRLPVTVTNNTGRLRDVVHFVREAWNQIQKYEPRWRWRRMEWSGQTSAGVNVYGASTFGIDALLAEWDPVVDMYCSPVGKPDGGILTHVPYENFRHTYLRGPSSTGRPKYWAIKPDNTIVLGPSPDGDYDLRGGYIKKLQTLSADGDLPEMPERFHDLIRYKAQMLFAEADESVTIASYIERNYRTLFDDLTRSQRDRLTLNFRPLA